MRNTSIITHIRTFRYNPPNRSKCHGFSLNDPPSMSQLMRELSLETRYLFLGGSLVQRKLLVTFRPA